MKKLLVIALLTVSGIAAASCPPYSPYGCRQGFNGKMVCGCGIR